MAMSVLGHIVTGVEFCGDSHSTDSTYLICEVEYSDVIFGKGQHTTDISINRTKLH